MNEPIPAEADGPSEHRMQVDQADPDGLQAAIVEGVATVAGVEAADLDPLYGAVDPDALSRLFRDSAGFYSISFVYAGHRVRLFADGELVVRRTA